MLSSSDPWNRRNFIAAVVFGAVSAGLAAYALFRPQPKTATQGGGVGTTPAPTGTTPAGTSAAGTPPATTTRPRTTAARTTPPGDVLIRTGQVAVGGGAVVTAKKVVVTQPSAGVFRAFDAVCTHQGCTVSTVSDGVIVCPCHNSKFDINDGSVTGGPASRALAPRAIDVHAGGEITLK